MNLIGNKQMLKLNQLSLAVALIISAPASLANPAVETPEVESPDSGDKAKKAPTLASVQVIGTAEKLEKAPGSATIIDQSELQSSRALTVNEALRKVPGVNVRDEEGFGLRPNIGIRGLNPSRSTKVLILEDGLFLSYAPYGDNASYFHPLMDRYDRVEVIKGADMLLYGPQTVSGTIDYVTPDPPVKPSGFAAVTGGNRDYFNGQAFYGGWQGNVGGLVDYVHKQGDGARENTHHEVNDVGL